jgi:phage baseplate assembly protein W
MLTIKDFDGVDLVENPPATINLRAFGEAQAVPVSIQARIIEDNPFLSGVFVNGTLNWNDGSMPTTFVGTAGTLVVDEERSLTNGDYLVTVYGENYRVPVRDKVQVNYLVRVTQENVRVAPPHIVYGPILPRDNGFPNSSQWMFNTDSDLLILESSVRMLLLTAKGERLMEPNYGTNLRLILFELNINGIESMVSDEIVSAITTWEPRVQLTSVNVTRTTNRAVIVNATFLSKLSSQDFNVNLEFVR